MRISYVVASRCVPVWAESFGWILFADWSVRVRPWERLRCDGSESLQRRGRSQEEIVRGILAVGRRLPVNCLVRSLALQKMLRRHGHPASIRLGARRGASGISAHAWVVAPSGEVLTGEDVSGFAVLDESAAAVRLKAYS